MAIASVSGDATASIEVGRGHAELDDARAAGRAAALSATAEIGSRPPSLVLVFSSRGGDGAEVLRGVREVTGEAAVVGVSAAAVVDAGELEPSVVVAAMASPEIRVEVGAAPWDARGWRASLCAALRAPGLAPYFEGAQRWLQASRAGRSAFALVFTSGEGPAIRPTAGELRRAVSAAAGGRLPVLVGAAGAAGGTRETWVLAGERVLSDGIAVAVVETSLQFGIATASGSAGEGRAGDAAAALRDAVLGGSVSDPALVLASWAGATAGVEGLARALAGTPLVGFRGADEEGVAASVLALGRELSREAQVARENALLRREVEEREAELRRSHEALRWTQAQQRALLDSIADMAWLKDHDGVYLSVNRPFAAFLGVAPEEAVGRRDAELWPPELARLLRAEDLAVMASGAQSIERQMAEHDGRTRWFEVVKVPYLGEGGAVLGTAAVARDVTERKEVEAGRESALRDLADALERVCRTEAQQRALLDGMTDFAWLKDQEGRFIAVNQSFAEVNGRAVEDMVGRTDYDVFERERADRNRAEDASVMASGAALRLEQELVCGTGLRIWVEKIKVPFRDEQGRVAGTVGIARDVTHRRELERLRQRTQEDLEALVRERTAMLQRAAEDLESRLEQLHRAEEERRRLEEQFRQAQKMEAVGRLAGGVAHDFNNLLTVILGSAKDLARRSGGDAEARELAEEVLEAGQRAAALTRQLLAFSRQQALSPREIDVNEIVRGLEKMLRRLIGADIEIVTRLEDGLGPVLADPGQIEQVVMNLVVNARDAMPRGGRLTLQTREVERASEADGVQGGLRPHVLVAVSDTGHGMEPQVLEHVFEPFFTTKERGKGTGLGLATVFGIVKQSGGTVSVRSAPGAGTTFEVYLPRAGAPRPGAGRPRAEERAARGEETVLLVEDDAAVRAFMRRSLDAAGYRVLETGQPHEAVKLAGAPGAALDMLLTDVIMPAMAGPDLAARLLALRPGLRVLFVSGYTEDAGLRSGALPAGQTFLQKPFTGDELARAVRAALDGPLPRADGA